MGGRYDPEIEWKIYWETDIVKLMQYRHCMLEDEGALVIAARDKTKAIASLEDQLAILNAADDDDENPNDE